MNSVIDFGLMGIGDPACDLIPAWSLFDSNSRDAFRKEGASPLICEAVMDNHPSLEGEVFAAESKGFL